MSLLFSYIMFFTYYFTFEALTGITLGKVITRTKVTTQDGNKPTTYNIFIRTLWRIVPLEPLSWLEAAGWHDRQSNTIVISNTQTNEIE
jgi:uncharacterized RDD family membrane protein YckC